ncbi:MAG: hypothetical protein CXT78_04825 [Thaumarchaeota archaeon]|nr:MAG: hypothetical protein CXT78_04825 [Nitrososphaerota archaeon]
MSQSFEDVKNWLFNSDLVINDKNDKNCGAVHSYFDESQNKFSFLYPEITGYFLSTLRFLNSIEKNDIYIDYGKKSANWLLSLYDKYGGIIQGIYNLEPKLLSYSFDTAICAKGLLDYYLFSNDKKFLNFAKKLITETIDQSIESDGTIKPYKNLINNNFEENKNVWYMQYGCLHIKTAIPLLQLYSITKDETLLKKSNLICKSIIKFQNFDGNIFLHPGNKITNLHTFCYALEGLLYAYYVTKNKDYLENCINSIHWALKHISDDGSIELWFNSKYRSKAAYPIAQLIRLILLIEKISKNEFKNHKNRLLSFLISFQSFNKNINSKGGFYEEYYKSVFGWKKRKRINSWTSMFALQALFWNENNDISFENSIEYLY